MCIVSDTLYLSTVLQKRARDGWMDLIRRVSWIGYAHTDIAEHDYYTLVDIHIPSPLSTSYSSQVNRLFGGGDFKFLDMAISLDITGCGKRLCGFRHKVNSEPVFYSSLFYHSFLSSHSSHTGSGGNQICGVVNSCISMHFSLIGILDQMNMHYSQPPTVTPWLV